MTTTGQRHFEVVLNRSSGTLRELWSEDLPSTIEKRFAARRVAVRVQVVEPDELAQAFEAAIAAKPDALVVGGGDGTVTGAAARLAGSPLPLGVLPFGTFNLAARDARIPLETEDAVDALAVSEAVPRDLLAVAGEVCLCQTLLGFYPAMAMREEEYHGRVWWRKTLRVIGQTWQAFRRGAPMDIELVTRDGERLRRRTRFVSLVPGVYEDVASIIPQRSDCPRPAMSVYVSRHQSLAAVARGLLAYLFGRLRSEKDMERLETEAATLKIHGRDRAPVMIDGETMVLRLPIEARLRSGALLMLQPGKEGA